MIGNIKGVDGVIDNRSFRIFSEPVPPTETENNGYQDVIMVAKLTVYQDNLHVIFTKRSKPICQR